METELYERLSAGGETLRFRFIRPATHDARIPLVVMLTGDGPSGSKSLSWVNLPPRLADAGIATLLFDFAGLGYSDGERRRLTLTKGISNFRTVYAALAEFDWIDAERIGYMGSSFGACAALLCPDILNEARAIGLKSPCAFLPDAYINEIGLEALEGWQRDGYCEANGYDFDVLLDSFGHNAYQAATQIHASCFITHGLSDEVVPVSQSKYLSFLLAGPTELVLFPDCDHGYSGGNWEPMADMFVRYFAEKLTDLGVR